MVLLQFVYPITEDEPTPLYGPFRYLHMLHNGVYMGLWSPHQTFCIARFTAAGLWLAPNGKEYSEFIVRSVVVAPIDEQVANAIDGRSAPQEKGHPPKALT